MWSVSILDPHHPVLELVWSGRVEPEEVAQANEKLSECIKLASEARALERVASWHSEDVCA